VVLALVGIMQKPLFTGKSMVCGLRSWTAGVRPVREQEHFAGWTLMGLPLAVVLLCAAIATGLRGVKPGWRNKLLWLGSPMQAARHDWRRRRADGAVAGVDDVAFGHDGFHALVRARGVVRRTELQSGWRKAAAIVYLMLMAAVVIGWAGADTIVTRFFNDGSEFKDRKGAWQDALTIASRFRLPDRSGQ